jgi:hypothetical protein
MGILNWLFRKRRPEPTGAILLGNLGIQNQPGRQALVFGDRESLMRTAEAMEAVEQQGPKRPLLYMFQHVALREAAFENHSELIHELAGEASLVPLLHFWTKALYRCMKVGIIDIDQDDLALHAEQELFGAVAIHARKKVGFTAYVVSMPTPESAAEAHFATIVHKDDEPHEYMQASPSTRYLTLEKADNSDHTLLCEWQRDGSRQNYGDGPAPELEAFAEAVFERVVAR